MPTSGARSPPNPGASPLNDAPRWLRIEGIDFVPALIEKLIEETNKTATRIKEGVSDAQELAAAVNELAAGKKK